MNLTKNICLLIVLITMFSCEDDDCGVFELTGKWMLTKECDSIGPNCNLSETHRPGTWEFAVDGTFVLIPYQQDLRTGTYQLLGDTIIHVTFTDRIPPVEIIALFHLIDPCTFIYDPACFEVCMLQYEKE